jgi:hypothetical protein
MTGTDFALAERRPLKAFVGAVKPGLARHHIAQTDDFIFDSEFLSFEVADQIGIRQRAVKFFENHYLKARMIRLEFLNALLNSHTCSPLSLNTRVAQHPDHSASVLRRKATGHRRHDAPFHARERTRPKSGTSAREKSFQCKCYRSPE